MSNEILFVDLSNKIQHNCKTVTNDVVPYCQKISKTEKRLNDIYTYTLLVEALSKNSLQNSNDSMFVDIDRVSDIWHSCKNNVQLLANTYRGNHRVKYIGINPKVQKKLILTLLTLFEDESDKKEI